MTTTDAGIEARVLALTAAGYVLEVCAYRREVPPGLVVRVDATQRGYAERRDEPDVGRLPALQGEGATLGEALRILLDKHRACLADKAADAAEKARAAQRAVDAAAVLDREEG